MDKSPNAGSDGFRVLAAWAFSMIIIATTVAGLYFGRGFLIPLTEAALLVTLLGSLRDRIASLRFGGRGLPGWVASIVAIAIALAGLLVVLSVLFGQAREVAAAVPRYEAKFDAILKRIVEIVGEDFAARILEAIKGVDVAGLVLGTVNSASGFLGQVFMMSLFAAFLMADRVLMRKRLDLVSPNSDFGAEAARTIQRSARSVQSYVGIKSLISLVTALISYVIMKLLGLDFAETWGILTFALNFIPSIGSIIAVFLPALVALVQFDTITPFLVVVLGCGLVQFFIGNVVEPALTGRKLNLSPMMVILALTVWSALWGIPGAFLSVPITVCMMIVFAHVPGLRWVAILMSGNGRLEDLDAGAAKGDG